MWQKFKRKSFYGDPLNLTVNQYYCRSIQTKMVPQNIVRCSIKIFYFSNFTVIASKNNYRQKILDHGGIFSRNFFSYHTLDLHKFFFWKTIFKIFPQFLALKKALTRKFDKSRCDLRRSRTCFWSSSFISNNKYNV